MVYTLLGTQYLMAVHAACVRFQGHGVLLVGESGAGKSSLAYACTRRGWTYVSDDAISVVLRRAGHAVLGNPQTLRFRPTASSLFPEIKGKAALRNGKPTLEIRTERLRHFQTAYESAVDHIIFLNRLESEPDPVRLTPVSREDAFRRLSQNPWPNELSIHEQRITAIERLLDAKAYELTYRAIDPAIDLLERVVRGDKS
jgi:hypothetical protein